MRDLPGFHDRGSHLLTFKQFVERALPLVAARRFGSNGSRVKLGAQGGESSPTTAGAALQRVVQMIVHCEGPQTHLRVGAQVKPATSPELAKAARRHFRTSRFD